MWRSQVDRLLNERKKSPNQLTLTDFHRVENKRGLYLKLLSGGFNQNQMSFLKDQAIHGPKSSRLNMGGFDPKKMGQIAKIYKHALSL